MAIFVVSIIAPCGKTHQPRCPGTQGRGWRPTRTSGRAPIRGEYDLSRPGAPGHSRSVSKPKTHISGPSGSSTTLRSISAAAIGSISGIAASGTNDPSRCPDSSQNSSGSSRFSSDSMVFSFKQIVVILVPSLSLLKLASKLKRRLAGPGRGRLASAASPAPSLRLRYQAALYNPSFADIYHAGRTRIADRRPSLHLYHNEPHPLIQVAMEPMHPYSSAHAVWIDATSPRPSSAIAWALSTCLRTLPVTVRGRDCTMAMCWGILK